MLVSCAAPSEPTPPTEVMPNAVTDLTAHQAGTEVILHFTLPTQASDGSPLSGPPRIEIRSELPSATGTRPAASIETIEAAQLRPYRTGDEVTFPVPMTAEDLQAGQGKQATYRVRVAQGRSAWSPESNAAHVTLVEPPAPPTHLAAKAESDGVTLRWLMPGSGFGLPPTDYVIYRTLLSPQNPAAAPAPVGMTAEATFLDTETQRGARYRYTVRSVAAAPGGQVESADSAAVEILFTGSGAPAAPTGLVAVVVGLPTGSLEVDLSWAISGQRSLAGYNIYRSEQPDERGQRLNRQLVVATAFRDTTAAPGRSYFYAVTVVDLAGNESAPSAAAAVNTRAAASGAH